MKIKKECRRGGDREKKGELERSLGNIRIAIPVSLKESALPKRKECSKKK